MKELYRIYTFGLRANKVITYLEGKRPHQPIHRKRHRMTTKDDDKRRHQWRVGSLIRVSHTVVSVWMVIPTALSVSYVTENIGAEKYIYIYKLCLQAVPRPYSKQLKLEEILDSPKNGHYHSQKGSVRIPNIWKILSLSWMDVNREVKDEIWGKRETDSGHRCYHDLLKNVSPNYSTNKATGVTAFALLYSWLVNYGWDCLSSTD